MKKSKWLFIAIFCFVMVGESESVQAETTSKPTTKSTTTKAATVKLKPHILSKLELAKGRISLFFISRFRVFPAQVFLQDLKALLKANPNEYRLGFLAAWLEGRVQRTTALRKYCQKFKGKIDGVFPRLACKAMLSNRTRSGRKPSNEAIVSWRPIFEKLMNKKKQSANDLYDLLIYIRLIRWNPRFKSLQKRRGKLLTKLEGIEVGNPWLTLIRVTLSSPSRLSPQKMQRFYSKFVETMNSYTNLEEAGILAFELARRLRRKDPTNKIAHQKSMEEIQKRMIKSMDSSPWAFWYGIHVMLRNHKPALTLQAFKKIESKISSDWMKNPATRHMIAYLLARRFHRNRAQSAQLLLKLSKMWPKDARVSMLLARVYMYMRKNTEAEAHYLAGVKLNPSLQNLQSLFYFYRHRVRSKKKAEQLIYSLLKKFPKNTWLLGQLANMQKEEKKYEAAEKTFLKILKADALNASAMQGLLNLYRYSLKNSQKAIDFLLRFLAKNPENIKWQFELASLYQRKKENVKAEALYKKLIKKHLRAYRYGRIADFYRHYKSSLPEALKTLEVGIKKYPTKASLHRDRAGILVKMGRPEDAEKAYLVSVVHSNYHLWNGRRYVDFLMNQNKKEKALSFTKAWLVRSKNNERVKSYYIKLLKKTGALEKARALTLSLAKGKDPRKVVQAYGRLGKHKAIVEITSKLILKNGKQAWPYERRADAYSHLKNYRAVAEDYKALNKMFPKKWYYYYKLSYVYSQRLKETAKALLVWDAYLRLEPNNVRALSFRASLSAKIKDYPAAMFDFFRMLEIKKWERYSVEKVARFFHYKMKRMDLAVRLWDQFLRKNPKSYRGYTERGWLFSRAKKFERASKDYNKAIKLKPSKSYAYNRLSSLYRYSLKDNARALMVWDLYIKQKPKDVTGYEKRARLFFSLSQYQQAIIDYNKAIQLDPRSFSSYLGLIQVYKASTKDPKKALGVIERYLKLMPWHKGALKQRALIHEKAKDFPKALKDWKHLYKISRSSWSKQRAEEGEARVLIKLHRYAEALKKLRSLESKVRWGKKKVQLQIVECLEKMNRTKKALSLLQKAFKGQFHKVTYRLTYARILSSSGKKLEAMERYQAMCVGPLRLRWLRYRAKACSALKEIQKNYRPVSLPFQK